jgi:hypothetical protein
MAKKGRRERAKEQSEQHKSAKKEQALADSIQIVLANLKGSPCEICGKPATHVDGFVPNDQRLYLGPEGKTRMFFIPLCTEHVKLAQQTPAMIEDFILQMANPIGAMMSLEVAPQE